MFNTSYILFKVNFHIELLNICFYSVMAIYCTDMIASHDLVVIYDKRFPNNDKLNERL